MKLLTSAHPSLEGELEVLAAPDVEAAVVGAEALEERPANGEEAARHRRRPDRLSRILVPLLLAIGHRVPVELTTPGILVIFHASQYTHRHFARIQVTRF